MSPNILWIMTDQHRRDCVGAYGDRGVRTPNLDTLAANGVVFDRFYSTCPLCVPARSSLHTGRYPHSCGALINGFGKWGDQEAAMLNAGEVTVSELLVSAGYQVAHVGVNHVKAKPPLPERVPFAKFVSKRQYAQYCAERGLEAPDMWAHQKPCPTRFGDEIREVRFSAPNPGKHPFAVDDYLDMFYARQAAEFIARAPDDRPFAVFLFLWLPHPPFVIPEPYFSMYRPEDVNPPPNLMASQAGKPPLHLTHLPGQIGGDPSYEEWLETWAAYFGAVTLVDACIGRVLTALDEKGVADDTLIIFHPDHGEMLGAHRYFQKMVCYEEAIRLPLIIRPPRCMQSQVGDNRRDQLCSHIDIAPTILDYAGVDPPPAMQGQSLRVVVEQPDAPSCDAVFCEYNGNVVLDVYQRAIITDRYKYIWNQGGFTELYDLQQDPYELENLAGRDDLAAIEEELRARLLHWMADTGDFLELT